MTGIAGAAMPDDWKGAEAEARMFTARLSPHLSRLPSGQRKKFAKELENAAWALIHHAMDEQRWLDIEVCRAERDICPATHVSFVTLCDDIAKSIERGDRDDR